MPDSIRTLLFPHNFRGMPHRRLILNLLRSLHLLCLCIMLGGVYFQHSKDELTLWVIGVIVSGLGLFLVDLYGSCIALFEVRGISVLIKLSLIACLPFLSDNNQLLILMLIIIFSSFISHGTRRLRHKNFMSQAFQNKYGLREDT